MFQKPMRNDILIKRWQESNFSTKLNVEWRIAWNLTPDAWSFWEQEDQSKIKQIILCLLSVHSNCCWLLLLTEYSFIGSNYIRVFVESFSLFSGQTKRKLFILTPGYLLLTHIYILWQHSFTTRPTHCLIIARSHHGRGFWNVMGRPLARPKQAIKLDIREPPSLKVFIYYVWWRKKHF